MIIRKRVERGKGDTVNILLRILGVAGILIAVYLIVRFGFTWRISSPSVEQFTGYNPITVATQMFELDVPLDPPQVIYKDELDGLDALKNGFTLYLSSFTVIPMFLIALIGLFFYAIFTGEIVGAIAVSIMGAVIAFFLPFLPLVIWLAMFFQGGTGSYYLLWAVLGLPAIGLGFSSLYIPTRYLIIIFR